MTFGRRLKLYLIGVAIGSLIVYVALIKNRNRDFAAWLPENRVLSKLATNELVVPAELQECISCLNLTKDSIIGLIKISEVDFDKSEIQDKECPVYFLETNGDDKFELTIESCEKKSVLKKILVPSRDCNCLK